MSSFNTAATFSSVSCCTYKSASSSVRMMPSASAASCTSPRSVNRGSMYSAMACSCCASVWFSITNASISACVGTYPASSNAAAASSELVNWSSNCSFIILASNGVSLLYPTSSSPCRNVAISLTTSPEGVKPSNSITVGGWSVVKASISKVRPPSGVSANTDNITADPPPPTAPFSAFSITLPSTSREVLGSMSATVSSKIAAIVPSSKNSPINSFLPVVNARSALILISSIKLLCTSVRSAYPLFLPKNTFTSAALPIPIEAAVIRRDLNPISSPMSLANASASSSVYRRSILPVTALNLSAFIAISRVCW